MERKVSNKFRLEFGKMALETFEMLKSVYAVEHCQEQLFLNDVLVFVKMLLAIEGNS